MTHSDTAHGKIPVTVLTGFLGAGKTTLVNHILTAQHGRRIAVIENEFGDIPVDNALVISSDEEIFEMVQAELRRSGFEPHVRAGMVLTGGAAKMEGVVELAEEMLQMPVRVGIPQHVTGLGEVVGNPVHATGVGLLLMGSQIEHPRRPVLPAGRAGSFFKKVKDWYKGAF